MLHMLHKINKKGMVFDMAVTYIARKKAPIVDNIVVDKIVTRFRRGRPYQVHIQICDNYCLDLAEANKRSKKFKIVKVDEDVKNNASVF